MKLITTAMIITINVTISQTTLVILRVMITT